jgi:hypothetical protein
MTDPTIITHLCTGCNGFKKIRAQLLVGQVKKIGQKMGGIHQVHQVSLKVFLTIGNNAAL